MLIVHLSRQICATVECTDLWKELSVTMNEGSVVSNCLRLFISAIFQYHQNIVPVSSKYRLPVAHNFHFW